MFKAVGFEGRAFVQSIDFDMRQGSNKKAFDQLDNHQCRKKTFCIFAEICFSGFSSR